MIPSGKYQVLLRKDRPQNRKDFATVVRWNRANVGRKAVAENYIPIVRAFVFGILAGVYNEENKYPRSI